MRDYHCGGVLPLASKSYERFGINRDDWIFFLLLPYSVHPLCNGYSVFINFSSSHPLWFLFFLSLFSFPQGLNYPVFFKVTWTWYFLLPLVSPSDPPSLWKVHSHFPWQAQVFLSTSNSCCSTQYWRKCLVPCTEFIPVLLVKEKNYVRTQKLAKRKPEWLKH